MARIIPTTETPGATEAGTIDFLDQYLSGVDYVYARPDGRGFERLEGRQRAAWQERIAILRARYVEGILALDELANDEFGRDFVRLDAEQQDLVLTVLGTGERALTAADVEGVTIAPDPPVQKTNAEIDLPFVPLLCLHTRQGFYSDPAYGGNRNHVGWTLIGFVGPASLAETQTASYSTLAYFAENHEHPAGQHDSRH